MASGIYAIVNKRSGGWYVGQSTDVDRRRKDPVAYAAWCKKISDGKRRAR